MLGINGSELLVLLAVAAVVLGPERLPHYTQQLTRLIRELRRMARGAQEKAREELGPDFDDVDWRAFDPRRYDPRRIMRDALSDAVDLDDPLGLKDVGPGRRPNAPAAAPVANGRAEQDGRQGRAARDDGPAPLFDPDAT